ncbi:MAG: hypothetical protein EOP04_09450, partial [Proteobacteria bacterium]
MLLRFFPLVKQSLEEDSLAPLLWYGKYVDFGGFDAVLNRKSQTKSIQVSIVSEVHPERKGRNFLRAIDGNYLAINRNILSGTWKVDISLENVENETIWKEITLEKSDFSINFKLQKTQITGLRVNGIHVKRTFNFERTSLLPIFHIKPEDELQNEKAIIEVLKKLLKPSLKDGRIQAILYELPIDSKESALNYLLEQKLILKPRYSSPNFSVEFADVFAHIVVHMLPDIVRSLRENLSIFFKSVQYIAPVRATAERYYRHQELVVSEIDSGGANLPMFLASLKAFERADFNKFIKSIFEFEINAEASGGHVELKIVTADGQTNIADTGFGFSQMLPILAQIWLSMKKNSVFHSKFARKITLAIEQPELHLHPKYQKLFGRMLCQVIKSYPEIDFFIETHSEQIVAVLGEQIERSN